MITKINNFLSFFSCNLRVCTCFGLGISFGKPFNVQAPEGLTGPLSCKVTEYKIFLGPVIIFGDIPLRLITKD